MPLAPGWTSLARLGRLSGLTKNFNLPEILFGLTMIKDILVTPLKIINTPGGNVMHAMKESSEGYMGFGEAYFSLIECGSVKAWKRHKRMTLNLIVPLGEIKFVFFDDRNKEIAQMKEVLISQENFYRLTIPPMIWIGFEGVGADGSMLLNIADIEHDPNEVNRKDIGEISYGNWS